MEGKSSRIEWLDQLRGYASLLVVIHHLVFAKYFTGISSYFNLGIIAVTLFFCVSGYIMPLTTKSHGVKGIKEFLISRFFRLYPAYWISIILAVLAFGGSMSLIFFNITMFQEFFRKQSINGVYWTLTVELMYYIIMASLVFLNKTKEPHIYLRLSFLFSIISLAFSAQRYFMHYKSPLALPIGLTTMFYFSYYVSTTKIRNQRFSPSHLTLIIVSFIILSYFLGYSSDWGYNENPFRFLLSNFIAVSIFLLYINSKLRSKIVFFLARVSYAVYLIHTSISSIIDGYLFPKGFSQVALTFSLKVIIIYVIAWIISKLVEEPFVKLSRAIRKV